ncbi:MAG: glycosyltransferase [Bacteroidia bacterium]|jgi:cellulose synthase/poly-beta-1,6-N-acetylglucosamine synthase-like glycosyltransferase|nr:glycosyltransferase [Bacteroidia bacterium]
MLIGSVILTSLYCALIAYYFWGWVKIKTDVYDEHTTTHKPFTILVSVRNEAYVIEHCLASLSLLDYPTHLVEVLLIDDHSTDDTVNVVNRWIQQHAKHHWRLLKNIANQSGKKSAITLGVQQAKHPNIVLTDADCTHHRLWLQTLNSYLLKTNAKLIYAPVKFKSSSIFEQIQALEFAGLVAIGGAAIALNNPNMCSASNLFFTAQSFTNVGGYEGNEHVSSGDDGFLLHKIANKYPGEVYFLKSKTAMVQTSASSSLLELANQRKRWVSKSTKYENAMVPAVLIGAYLFNLSILVNAILNPELALIQLAAKITIEGLFLWNVLDLFDTKKHLRWLLLAEPLHIMYVIIIGIWGNLGTFNWKGRNVKP